MYPVAENSSAVACWLKRGQIIIKARVSLHDVFQQLWPAREEVLQVTSGQQCILGVPTRKIDLIGDRQGRDNHGRFSNSGADPMWF